MRLAPTRREREFLAGCAGLRRKVRNDCTAKVREIQDLYRYERDYLGLPSELRVKPLSHYDLRDWWKKEQREDWATKYSSWVPDYAARDAATALRKFMLGKLSFRGL